MNRYDAKISRHAVYGIKGIMAISLVLLSTTGGAMAAQRCQPLEGGKGDGIPRLAVCLKAELFTHHEYTLLVDGRAAFTRIDDDVTRFSVIVDNRRITGGCVPENRHHTEISRTCSVRVDGRFAGQTVFRH